MTSEDRAQELRQLKQENPLRLIALYRYATGTDDLGPLPPGVGFEAMIDAIVAYEVATGNLRDEPPAS